MLARCRAVCARKTIARGNQLDALADGRVHIGMFKGFSATLHYMLPPAHGQLVFAPSPFGKRLDLHLILLDADFGAAREEGDFRFILDRARLIEPAAAVDERFLVEGLLERIDCPDGQLLAFESQLSRRS